MAESLRVSRNVGRQPKRRALTTDQRCYLAGLIDAAGTIESPRKARAGGRSPSFHLRLSFTSTSPEPLQTVAGWLGCEVKSYAWRRGNTPSHYRLRFPKETAYEVLSQCLPILIRKRRQAEIVLAIERLRAGHSPDRRHVGQRFLSRIPARAVSEMHALHDELLNLSTERRQLKAGAVRA